ncbi:MAG: transketolase family protein [Candidatus Thermoplasmatota archaeon]
MKQQMANPRDAYGQALVQIGKKNESIVVLDADLSKSTKTILFAKQFPNRFFEMGIAEANMISTAAGLASCGKIPFASTFAVFATGRVYDQIRMDVAYSNHNVKIFATHGGISVGKDGASHQMIEDIALMRVLPNMKVFAPSDALQTQRVVELMAFEEGPMYSRIGRESSPILYSQEDTLHMKIGKGIIVCDGDDATLIACGTMVSQCIEASKKLKKEGIYVRVLDMFCIKPLDQKLILRCSKDTQAILTVEEHSIIGGLGSAVAEVLLENGYTGKFKRIGIQDMFCESGEPEHLFNKYGLSAQHIIKNVKTLLKKE